MKCTYLLLACVLVAATHTQAQIAIGPEVGVNSCAYTEKADGVVNVTQIKGSIRAGIRANIKLAGNWYLQPGLLYVNNGVSPRIEDGGGGQYMNINTLEIPAQLVYKMKSGGVARPFFAAGPYMAWNMSGRVNKWDGNPYAGYPRTIEENLKVGSAGWDDIKALDFGLTTSVGMELNNGLYVRAILQKGFTNLLPGGNAGNTMTSNNISLCFGYFFKSKPPAKKTDKK